MKIILVNGIKLLYKTFCILLLLTSSVAFAQSFTLSVTATNETCPGNGALQFTVQNGGGSVNYKVYLLPNTTTPISDNSNTSINGLQDGTYLVVATTTVNGSTVTDQKQATVADNTTPFNFADDFTSTPSFCNDGIINVAIDTGTAVSYQLTGGPQPTAPQTSATFTGLPPGLYTIKATDTCGTAIVTTFNLGTTAPQIQLLPGGFAAMLPDCNHAMISAAISDATYDTTTLQYPMYVDIILHPPGGAPAQTFSQTIAGGPQDIVDFSQIVPLYYNQNYSYDLIMTDSCGRQFTMNNNPLFGVFSLTPSTIDLECGNKALQLTPNIYLPPFSINFINPPAGFDPTINPQYPDSFTGPVVVFGTDEHPLIPGTYNYTATDACGRTTSGSYEFVLPDPIVPEGVGVNYDCENNLGTIISQVPSRNIVSAIIVVAPQEFEDLFGSVPYDASAFIDNEGKLYMEGLPPGDYEVVYTDECDVEYDPFAVEVPEYTVGQKNPVQRPDCEPGMGTVYIGSGLTEVIMLVVPNGSPISTPFNCAQYISNGGDFSLDNLTPGTYKFQINDGCQVYEKTINLAGYTVTSNSIGMTPYCGAFDVSLYYDTNAIAVSFWLQREITPGNWGHPGTGQLFNGTYNQTTAYMLTNNTVNTTLPFPQGQYRIVKTHRAYESGDIAKDKTCTEYLYTFYYTDRPQILGVSSLTCTGLSGDVQVNATGVQPLTYTITEKNGDPFTIANGYSNAFMGLDSAVYKVEVSDICGYNEVYFFNLAEIPSLVNANPPGNLPLCDAGMDGVETFELGQQNAAILNNQNSPNITITYHASYNDADLGINPLPYSYTTGPTTIYARATYVGPTLTCHDITQFDLILHQSSELQMQETYNVCDGSNITIIADAGYATYSWSTGAVTPQITVNQSGQYTVTAITSQGCVSSKTVEVFTTALPAIQGIVVQDWTETDNVINVAVEPSQASVQNFEYSINGIIWQDSNIFTGLQPGSYTVYVRDVYGCDYTSQQVYLLTYPRFFTPNGDGLNETWRIAFSSMAEPDLMVQIYDRYGKLITGFGANSLGWDGTLNGTPLPATDYWFVVRRQNGKEYRGHFSLLR